MAKVKWKRTLVVTLLCHSLGSFKQMCSMVRITDVKKRGLRFDVEDKKNKRRKWELWAELWTNQSGEDNDSDEVVTFGGGRKKKGTDSKSSRGAAGMGDDWSGRASHWLPARLQRMLQEAQVEDSEDRLMVAPGRVRCGLCQQTSESLTAEMDSLIAVVCTELTEARCRRGLLSRYFSSFCMYSSEKVPRSSVKFIHFLYFSNEK